MTLLHTLLLQRNVGRQFDLMLHAPSTAIA
jgi:hypothetical protein